MKELVITITTYIGLIILIWYMGRYFANEISDYEVISPKDGIECVVVSRMFNTSVDCWAVND